jgi:hypothetical protein
LNKEYDRSKGDGELFMRNPNLYRIGMNNECFGNEIMLKWIAYAIIHAFWVYYTCFYSTNSFSIGWNSPQQEDGKGLDFWIGGHVVFGSCILISNLIIF